MDRAPAGLAVASAGFVALVLLWLVGRPLATDDTWWHLVMGALYAGGDLWPREDPLLHTTVLRAPVPHEWLFQVALHGVREAFGFVGLRALHVLCVGAILAVVWRSFRATSRDTTVVALALIVLVVLSWFRFMQLRPDVVSALATVALYAWVLRPSSGPGTGRAVAGLVLLLCWANAHSLFAVGLCLVFAALLGTGLHAALARGLGVGDDDAASNRRRAARLAGFLALAVAISALNPRGFDQHLTFLTESQAGLIWRIQDDFLPYHPFAPPDGAGPAFTPLAWALADATFGAFLAIAALRLARLLRRRDAASLRAFDAVHFGLGLAAFVAALVAVRFHWLAFFPLVYLLRTAPHRLPVAVRAPAAGVALLLAAALPPTAGAAALRAEVAREPGGYWRSPWLDVRYAGAGARFLADAGLTGRLYHPFNLGGFLGYTLAPGLRTFIDGRLDHVPAEVLDDYLVIRRTSRHGPTAPLRERLDRWGIDVFFADTFPEAWYEGRESGYHLRRLPEWLPVFVARSHAIYLRRNPRNRANLARVARYWAERGVPFDALRGFDPGRVIALAPEQARELGLVLPEAERTRLEALARQPETRVAALDALASHAWRVGDFARQLDLDRELLEEAPDAREPGLRLGDALLQLGRAKQARQVLASVEAAHPDDAEVARMAAVARAAAGAKD